MFWENVFGNALGGVITAVAIGFFVQLKKVIPQPDIGTMPVHKPANARKFAFFTYIAGSLLVILELMKMTNPSPCPQPLIWILVLCPIAFFISDLPYICKRLRHQCQLLSPALAFVAISSVVFVYLAFLFLVWRHSVWIGRLIP